MIRIIILWLMISIALASAAAFAQVDEPDLDQYGLLLDIGLEAYATDESGNMDEVREYDGRRYRFVDIGTLCLINYSDSSWFNYLARDVFSTDPDHLIKYNTEDILSLRVRYQDLTHRLAPVPLVDPVLTGDSYISLEPNTGFRYDRSLLDFRTAVTPPGLSWLRLAAEFWGIDTEGSRQLLFRSRSTRLKYQGLQQADRDTEEWRVGVDLSNWSSALNYRHLERRFNEKAPPPTYQNVDTRVPIKVIVPDSTTSGNILSGRTDITGFMRTHIDRNGESSWLTAQYSHKKRKNLSARTSILTAEPPVNTAELPRDPEIRIIHQNLALTHLHGDNLVLTARYRHLDYDNRSPFLRLPAPTPETGEILNQIVDRRYTSYELDATYTGIQRLTLRGGYMFRRDRRSIGPVHEVHEEFAHGPIAETSRHNILRLGSRYRPTQKMTLQINSRYEDIDAPIFNGTPSWRWDVNTDFTYSITDNVIFLANFSNWREKNGSIPPPGAIPLTDPDFTLIRDIQAGAQYSNRVQTWDAAIWAMPAPRLTVDVHVGRYDVRSRAYWVLGTDPRFLPIIEQPELVPHQVRSLYLSGSVSYRVARKWLLRANLMHVDSEGETTSFSLFSKVPDPTQRVFIIQPVDVRTSRDAVGLEYQASRDLRFVIEHSWNNWSDYINSGKTGKFQLLSLGVWYDF